MYFRFSLRHNPAKGKSDSYYRLTENYRNEKDRVCHRTLLNVGFLDDLVTIDQLNQVRRIPCNRRKEALGDPQLFDMEKNNEYIVNKLADEFWHKPVSEKRIDTGQKPKKEPTVRQRNMVFEESIRHPDVRKIGAKWLCFQALEQLLLSDIEDKIYLYDLSNTCFEGRKECSNRPDSVARKRSEATVKQWFWRW